MSELKRRDLLRITAAGIAGAGVTVLFGQETKVRSENTDSQDVETSDSAEEGEVTQEEIERFVNKAFSESSAQPEESAQLQVPVDLLRLQEQYESVITIPEGAVWLELSESNRQLEATGTRRAELGTHTFPNQHRLHKHGTFDYRVETRKHSKKIWVDISHPQIEDFANDAIECAIIAGTASVVAAAAATPAAGLALFLPSWKVCMYAKISRTIVDDTRVRIGSENTYTCWTYHC